MTRRERITRLMALAAQRDAGALARDMNVARDTFTRHESLDARMRGLLDEANAASGGNPVSSVGALSVSMQLGHVLATELERNAQMAEDARKQVDALSAKFSQADTRKRILKDRAWQVRCEAAEDRAKRELDAMAERKRKD